MRFWLITLCFVGVLIGSGMRVAAQSDDASLFPAGTDYYLQAFVEGDGVVYVGEQVVYVLRTYVRDRTGARSNIFETLPDFDGFWRSTALEPRNPPVEVVNGVQYVVLETYVLLYPLQSGTLMIAPSRLEVFETLFRDAAEFYSDPVTVEVQPLPSPAPQNFSGAVGQFRVEMTLEPAEVALGEPLTLRLTLTGEGNLEQVPAPSLRLPERWRVFENDSSARLDSNIAGLMLWSRQYEYLLVPPNAGTVQFAPLVFVYFDPFTEEYVALEGSEFTVNVFPGNDGLLSLERPSQQQAVFAPELLAVDLSATRRVAVPSWWMWMVMPLLVLIAGSVPVIRSFLRSRLIAYRSANALKRALSQLETVQDGDDYAVIEQIILGYCWDSLGYLPADCTGDLWQIISEKVSDASMLDRLQTFLRHVEAVRYAPKPMRPQIAVLVNRAVDLLKLLDKQWIKV